MSISTFLQATYLQDVNMTSLEGGTQSSEIYISQLSTYSSKLKGLLNIQLDKDKLDGIYMVYMQFSYSRLNSFVKPGFHLKQTPRPRHKEQSDYLVEQSSFPLIALF